METDHWFNIHKDKGKISEVSWVCDLRTGGNRKERLKERDGMDRTRLDSIRGFLVYISRTC